MASLHRRAQDNPPPNCVYWMQDEGERRDESIVQGVLGAEPAMYRTLEHSNSRFELIRFVMRFDSFCKKNRPFDSLVVMQFLH